VCAGSIEEEEEEVKSPSGTPETGECEGGINQFGYESPACPFIWNVVVDPEEEEEWE